MPRFFFDKQMISDKTVTLYGQDAAHISQSLRMTRGDRVILCDGEGFDYDTEIVEITREAVTVSVKNILPSVSEPPYRITLYQCLPKGEKLETVIQKSVECGVSAIVPVQSSRCIVKWRKDDEDKKLLRANRIADEAAKQSGRGSLPKVLPSLSYREAILAMTKSDMAFLCYENEENKTVSRLLRESRKPTEIAFLIGPEGGLSEEEVGLAKEQGIEVLSLGHRILRTETAAPFVLAILSAFYEL